MYWVSVWPSDQRAISASAPVATGPQELFFLVPHRTSCQENAFILWAIVAGTMPFTARKYRHASHRARNREQEKI